MWVSCGFPQENPIAMTISHLTPLINSLSLISTHGTDVARMNSGIMLLLEDLIGKSF